MKVIREIRRGGFGRVDEVIDNGTRYARKTFEPSIPTTPAELDKLRKRFDREVRVQAAIKSNAVMPIERYDLDDEARQFGYDFIPPDVPKQQIDHLFSPASSSQEMRDASN